MPRRSKAEERELQQAVDEVVRRVESGIVPTEDVSYVPHRSPRRNLRATWFSWAEINPLFADDADNTHRELSRQYQAAYDGGRVPEALESYLREDAWALRATWVREVFEDARLRRDPGLARDAIYADPGRARTTAATLQRIRRDLVNLHSYLRHFAECQRSLVAETLVAEEQEEVTGRGSERDIARNLAPYLEYREDLKRLGHPTADPDAAFLAHLDELFARLMTRHRRE